MTIGIPAIDQLWHLFTDEGVCAQYLLDNGAFYGEHSCQGCGHPMVLKLQEGIFRCGKKSCRRKIALARGSFFSNRKLTCSQILHLGYLWLCKTSPSAAS